jgi:hypothetical protein
LTDEQLEFCTEVADSKGLSVDEYLRRVVDEAVEKERYRVRSLPKAKKPSGRPANSSKDESLRLLVPGLRRVYAKLREDFGKDFERIYGAQEAELNEAILQKNVEVVERFEREQPWIKKKW